MIIASPISIDFDTPRPALARDYFAAKSKLNREFRFAATEKGERQNMDNSESFRRDRNERIKGILEREL